MRGFLGWHCDIIYNFTSSPLNKDPEANGDPKFAMNMLDLCAN